MTKVDFLNKGQVVNAGQMRPYIHPKTGDVVSTVYSGGDPSKKESWNTVKLYSKDSVQANATLRRDEWKSLDEAILKISEQRLGGVQDLISKGLTYQLGNGMGTTVFEYHDVSDALSADLTMDGVTRDNNDAPNYTTNYLPMPIIHSDYQINARVLAASRNLGNPIDTTLAERAARKVNEKLETILFTDDSYTYGGGTIYGYVNHPDRTQVTLSDYGNWDNESATAPRRILDSILEMKQQLINSYHYGPYVLYIPTNYETIMDDDFEDTDNKATGMTIRERILKVGNLTDVKVVDTLVDDNVVMVQMTSDVIRLVQGMGMTNVQWSEEGNMVSKFKVMTIQVPQVRSDQDGNSGIVHMA